MSATHKLLRFGVFELNLSTEELRKSGTLIKLPPQPFQLLALLASRAGQIVAREEIQQQLWGEETYVDFEQGMNHCVKQIRAVLSDNADNPLYVETIPRRGYRFLAPVVSKTILAPAPKITESKSGIQSSIATALRPDGTLAADTVPARPRDPVAASQKQLVPPAASSEAAASPLEVAAPEPPVPTSSSETVRPPYRGRTKATVVALVVLVVAVVAGLLYWRSRRSGQLTEKDTIVLAEFQNTTGQSVFDAALQQALAIDVEQSPFLNVLSEQKVAEQLRYMGLPRDTRLTPDVAREVCQRSGSKAMLVGSVSQLGSQYVVSVQAVGCASGDSLGSEQAEANSRDQVPNALGKVVSRLRQRLGESLASVQKYDTPVEQATTPSLDALKAYSLGIQAGDVRGYAAAVPYFRQAIDLDPKFAMAYARLGVEYANLNRPSLAAENVTKAYELRDKTSQREKLYITCHYHDLVTGDVDQAIAAYQLFRQAYPREASAYMNLNSLYNSIGKYDQALSEAQSALQVDPGDVVNYLNLAVTYIALNRVDEAKSVLEQALAHKLEPQGLLAAFYMVAFLRGDAADMARQVTAAAGKLGVEDQLLAMQSDTEAYDGRLDRARELTQLARASALHAGAKETAALWQLYGALHEAELGDPQRAKQDAGEALDASPGRNGQILAALALARAGESKRALALAQQLGKQYPSDTLVNYYWLPAIEAAVALDARDPQAALKALQPAAPYELGSPPPGVAMYPVYLRGLAYLAAGDGAQAAAEFQKILDHRGIVQNFPTGSLAYLQLARARAMAGDKTAARKSCEQFLALWKNGDAGNAVLQAAKAEYAKLR